TEITHSAFVLPTTYGNIAFATTAVRDVGDLYIHVEAPAVNSWFAFGTGLGMKGSLMWVFYRDEREKGIVLSTRTAAGNLEPRHTDQIPCELNIRNGITNGLIKPSDGPEIYVANVYCKNINKYLLSSIPVLDFSNTAQPFIFALGPTDKTVHTNKKDALIRRHTLTGQFTLSLPPATVNTTTAVSQTQLARISVWSNHHSSLSSSGPRTDNGAWKGSFHAALMCGTYIIVFPAGVLLLRVFESVLAHAWTQAFGVFLLFCGTGIALHLSLAYNHAKRLDSLHQILGLSVVSLTLIQLALGILHHWLFAKHGRPTILGHIHLYLGPLVLLLGAANGFLGFRFAGGSSHNLMYGIFVAVVFIGLALVLWW
ncbi:iron reductase domain protein, partial [Amniculicola lignicola CBS 123094]